MHARADDPIDQRGGRFVTVLPRSRKEDGFLRDGCRPTRPSGARRSASPASEATIPIWCGARRPRRSPPARATGSSGCAPAPRSAATPKPASRIERGLGALAELQARLAGPKSRLRTARRSSKPPRPRSTRPAPSAGSPSPSPRPCRRPTARRNAAGPAKTPATASTPRPASSCSSPSTPTPSPTTPTPTGASR